jgi:1-acyl-sn-glycerol-3-phosphate acyltransferase
VNVPFDDAGHGYDVFGMSPRVLAAAAAALHPVYHRYFRVHSHGIEHVPARGAAILAANHGGLLPIDGALVVLDVLARTDPPRAPRPIGDLFIPFLPWVGTLLSRAGVVSGSAGNFRHLLERGELVLVFPEGSPGIGKGFRRRYRLQAWRPGHAELAIRHRVRVVPVAVIGSEEAWPQLARIDRVHPFGAPFLPLPAVPFPLPVRHDIYYGAPIRLHERYAAADADDPERLRAAAEEIRRAVEELIVRGRRERRRRYVT